MKTNIRILFVLLTSIIISNNSNAQLKVRTNGTVKIGTESTYPSGGSLEITGINQTLEARIFPASANIARFWTINSVYAFGFGIDQSGYGQIFRNINSPSSIMTFNSNGDFGIGRTPSYKLDVNGSIRVNTTIYTSDSLLKSNINNLKNQASNLDKLRSVSYNLNTSSTTENNEIQTETMNPNKQIGKKVNEAERLHYGFIAQEVKKIYPELVYEDDAGIMGIDYVAFIPLLVEELKNQNKIIEGLKQDITALKESSVNFSSVTKDNSNGELFQNFPNPFNENEPHTVILSFDIPEKDRIKRNWLRNQIKIFGYKMLQQSLWVGPGPLPAVFIKRLEKMSIRKHVKTFKISKKK